MVVSGDFCDQQQSYKWFILAFDNCYWNCCRKLAEAVTLQPHSNCRKFVQQLHSICWNHQVCCKNNIKLIYIIFISMHINIFLLLHPLPFVPRGSWILNPINPFNFSKNLWSLEALKGLNVYTTLITSMFTSYFLVLSSWKVNIVKPPLLWWGFR